MSVLPSLQNGITQDHVHKENSDPQSVVSLLQGNEPPYPQ